MRAIGNLYAYNFNGSQSPFTLILLIESNRIVFSSKFALYAVSNKKLITEKHSQCAFHLHRRSKAITEIILSDFCQTAEFRRLHIKTSTRLTQVWRKIWR
ncbi:hypothetical protein TH6_02310 [Thalassospira profundimaris]|uniref:Uncharacterized protein n=1 Tax=Thalassospira profundimaris TaxID=502049 RepID=A0A367VJT3_9PROT|nr:hypothetical protein TH6_02310 [Thalassospira profundimaris]